MRTINGGPATANQVRDREKRLETKASENGQRYIKYFDMQALL